MFSSHRASGAGVRAPRTPAAVLAGVQGAILPWAVVGGRVEGLGGRHDQLRHKQQYHYEES